MFSFLNACPKLDHMAQVGFHGDRFKCFKVSQKSFSTKGSNQIHCTNGNSLVINESGNTKKALFTYVRLTVNEIICGSHKLG